jgi:hypothetical protein
MSTQSLSFTKAINSSLQIGDRLFFSPPPVNGITHEPMFAGVVTNILRRQGIIEFTPNLPAIPLMVQDSFIFFEKDIRANESNLKGYYADVTLKNHSTKKVELFAVSSEIGLSSK